ncbi:MAG: sugar phosphate isomerase/epimerase family protein [Prolixibacteraceae bacterium]
MSKRKYSVFLGNVGTCFDRYCPSYAKPFSIEELFERVASIELLSGVDIVATPDLLEKWDVVKKCVDDTGLKVVSIAVDHFTQEVYRQGSFSSVNNEVRQKAVDDTKRVMDLAAELDCPSATIWPGQDGWDYVFQADYMQERTWFAEGIKEACRHRSDIGVYVEYKMKEPRTHSYLNTAGNTILILNEIDEPNSGAIIDYGHALLGYENPAESVVLFKKYGDKLKHIHINDNYRYWDDDMIVGSIRQAEYLEFFYWLRRTGYDSWMTIDQFPYREDGRNAVEESAIWMDLLESILDSADMDEIGEVLKTKDAVEASRLMRKLMYNR